MKFAREKLLLYAVTDRTWLGDRELREDVERAILGGATMIQLREKDLNPESFLKEAFVLKELCNQYQIPLIINDNLDIMLASDVDGIHIGQDDLNAAEVRKKIGPHKIMGVSCKTVEEACIAYQNGADYLGVGAIFSTNTKRDAVDVSIEELRKICQAVPIPVVAIGGIQLHNIEQLKNTMIDGIAVVSAIFAEKDIVSATKILSNKLTSFVFTEKQYSAAIIDYDGTLIDSMQEWMTFSSSFIKSLGLTPERNLDKKVMKFSTMETVRYLKEGYMLPYEEDELLNLLNRFVEKTYLKLSLKKGSKELLDTLRVNHTKLILLSATDLSLIEKSLKTLNLRDYFTSVYSTSTLGLSKSTGEPYEYVLKKENLLLEETIIIEDAPYAIRGAKMKGCRVLGVFDSIFTTNEILEAEPDYYIDLRKMKYVKSINNCGN